QFFRLERGSEGFDRSGRSAETDTRDLDAQDLPDDGRDQLRIVERRELGEPNAVRIAIAEVPAGLDREPRLTDATPAVEGHQAMTDDVCLDLRQLGFASDQTGQLLRKIVIGGRTGPIRSWCRCLAGCGCRRPRRTLAFHRRDEAITPAGNGEQIALFAA